MSCDDDSCGPYQSVGDGDADNFATDDDAVLTSDWFTDSVSMNICSR